jgi:PKD repeat protein
MATARMQHTAVFLPNGKVLIAGGAPDATGGAAIATCELFDPTTGNWTGTGLLGQARVSHTLTILLGGKVLAAGGLQPGVGTSTACELYDPAGGTWTPTGALAQGRYAHTATLETSGCVLVAGGSTMGPVYLSSCERFDPSGGVWSSVFPMNGARYTHTATLLLNGMVLVAGGGNPAVIAACETFDANGVPTSKPSITTVNGSPAFPINVPAGSTLTVAGVRFRGVSESGGGHTNGAGSDFPLVVLAEFPKSGAFTDSGSARRWILPATGWEAGTALSVTLPPAIQTPDGQYLLYAIVNGIAGDARVLTIGTAPLAGTVSDGSATDIAIQNQASSISANWAGFGDPESGITQYEWAIGTTPGGTNIQNFITVGLTLNATASGLSLLDGQIYYVTVRATNGVGETVTATSNGVLVDTGSNFTVIGSTIVNNSAIFVDASDKAFVAVGDANNDGVVDLIVSRHATGGLGKMALYQRSAGAWNGGAVILTTPAGNEGVQLPSIGALENDGVQWTLHQMLGNGGATGALQAVTVAGIVASAPKTLDSQGAPGALYGVIADVDNDTLLEAYAVVREPILRLNKYRFTAGAYAKTQVFDTGVAQSAAVRPVAGDFAFAGAKSLVWPSSAVALSHTTFSGTYSSGPIFTSPDAITALAAGDVDGVPGTDIVVATDNGTTPQVYFVSGVSFTSTPIAFPPEPIAALACADLNADGRDEVYAAGRSGGIYQYTPAGGWKLLESHPGVQWTDGARARWTGATRDDAVFVGIEGTNITVRVLGLTPNGPTVSATAGTNAPATYNFGASFSNGALYQWDFDYNGSFLADYSSPSTGNSTFTYSLPGTYQAQLAVTYLDGTTSYFDTFVTVTAPPAAPTVSLAASSNNGIAPLPVTFTATTLATSGKIESYEWDFDGDGAVDFVSTTANQASFTYRQAGLFTCRVKVTDTAGVAAQATFDVTVAVAPNPPVIGGFTVPPAIAEPGQVLSFSSPVTTSTPTSIVRYEWDFDGNGIVDLVTTAPAVGGVATGSATYQYPNPGTYIPRVRVIDDNGTPLNLADDLSDQATGAPVTVDLPSSLKVWWAKPKDGDVVSGNAVTLHANTAPGNQTAKVEFFYRLNTGPVQPPRTDPSWVKIGESLPPPYSFFSVKWNTTLLPPGNYDLLAVATDLSGARVDNHAKKDVTVTVVAPQATPAPGVTQQDGTTSVSPVNPDEHHTTEVGGQVQVDLPPGAAVDASGNPVAANLTVTHLAGDPQPSQTLSQGLNLGKQYYQRIALDTGKLGKPGQVSFYYRDDNNDGIEDSTKLPADQLKGYRFDAVDNKWEELLDVTVDKAEKKVIMRTPGFSDFALGGRATQQSVGGGSGSCFGSVAAPSEPPGLFLWASALLLAATGAWGRKLFRVRR